LVVERKKERRRKDRVQVEFFFFHRQANVFIIRSLSLLLRSSHLPRPLSIAAEKSCCSGPLGRSLSPERPSRSQRGEENILFQIRFSTSAICVDRGSLPPLSLEESFFFEQRRAQGGRKKRRLLSALARRALPWTRAPLSARHGAAGVCRGKVRRRNREQMF